MIKKAQIKFITIVCSILLVVFLVIFFATFLLLRNANEKTVERTLNDTKQSFILANDGMIHANGLIVVLASNGTPINSYRDKNVFSEDSVDNIIKTVLSKPYDASQIGNVYYFIEEFRSGYIIIASDMTDMVIAFRVNLLTTFIILFSIYGLLFFIVWALSFKVFAPIKEAFYKQKQFVSNASHELKTPLTIISANTDVLRQGEDNQWLANIKTQTTRMNDLVADMLSLAKIDEGSVNLNKEKFNLSQIVIGSALPFDAVAFEKGKNLLLEVESDIQYLGDIQSVKKMVSILLDNAVKHAERGGDILVTLKKESNKIVLSVFNTGSYIPDNQANKIFERFYRGDDSRSRDSGGSGLGLSIAKSIADMNKWKISAISKFNESIIITVIL
ncbi:MAG: hypothetical protein IJX16_07230 [Clostridia bacterium]|nr:hypothetical protein [Clostridia bacterium]